MELDFKGNYFVKRTNLSAKKAFFPGSEEIGDVFAASNPSYMVKSFTNG